MACEFRINKIAANGTKCVVCFRNVQYVNKNGEESYMTMENYPKVHEKKMKLLSYFSRYMKEHLVKTGADMVKEYDSVSRTPHLNQWCRSTSGVLMLLSSGILQVIK